MFKSLLASFVSFVPGLRLIDGQDLENLASYTLGAKAGLVALAGGGAPGATALVYGQNEVATCATNADSTLLPLALPGATVVLINDGVGSCRTYPAQSNPSNGDAADTIAPHNTSVYGASADTAAAGVSVFHCAVLGKWKQTLLT